MFITNISDAKKIIEKLQKSEQSWKDKYFYACARMYELEHPECKNITSVSDIDKLKAELEYTKRELKSVISQRDELKGGL